MKAQTACGVIAEPARDLPVRGAYDVVVAGGGVAGVAAAIAAARNGARVCLLEKAYALGGLATLGNVTVWLPICDGRGRQVIGGLGEELMHLSVASLTRDNEPAGFFRPPACWSPGGSAEERKRKRYQAGFNPAACAFALEELVVREGVKLLYDTRLCAVRREGDRLTHLIVENKSGRFALACGAAIDATGDADLCFLAGERTAYLDSNVPAGWYYTFASGKLEIQLFSKNYSATGTKKPGEGPFFRGDDGEDVTAFMLKSRELIRAELAQLRAEHPGEDVQLLMPPVFPCMRMTRRLAGEFELTEAHVHQWMEDAIGLTGDWRKAGPVYAIPYRSLYGACTDNLLVAGRCISADNSVWDVTRAIPTCAVTGQAAGVAAAMVVAKTGGSLRALDLRALQDRLKEQGVILDPRLVTAAG